MLKGALQLWNFWMTFYVVFKYEFKFFSNNSLHHRKTLVLQNEGGRQNLGFFDREKINVILEATCTRTDQPPSGKNRLF